MSLFVCNPDDYWKAPPCCTCPPEHFEEPDACRDDCEWCTLGCRYVDDDGVSAECCMEREPPPEASVFHEGHPDYMPMGWPRPRSRDGLPAPYIAETINELGRVNGQRRMLCVVEHRCQVCGEPPGAWSVVCWGPGHAVVVDGALICERCWPVAFRLCPHLRALWGEGQLVAASVPTTELRTTTDTGLRAKIEGLGGGYEPPQR